MSTRSCYSWRCYWGESQYGDSEQGYLRIGMDSIRDFVRVASNGLRCWSLFSNEKSNLLDFYRCFKSY